MQYCHDAVGNMPQSVRKDEADDQSRFAGRVCWLTSSDLISTELKREPNLITPLAWFAVELLQDPRRRDSSKSSTYLVWAKDAKADVGRHGSVH